MPQGIYSKQIRTYADRVIIRQRGRTFKLASWVARVSELRSTSFRRVLAQRSVLYVGTDALATIKPLMIKEAHCFEVDATIYFAIIVLVFLGEIATALPACFTLDITEHLPDHSARHAQRRINDPRRACRKNQFESWLRALATTMIS